jgi:chaperonin GroES
MSTKAKYPKFRPLGNRVLVKETTPAKTTQSGIIIPDTAKDRRLEGIVQACGPGSYIDATGQNRPIEVKPGDKVRFAKHAGEPIELDGLDYLVLFEGDIFGVV